MATILIVDDVPENLAVAHDALDAADGVDARAPGALGAAQPQVDAHGTSHRGVVQGIGARAAVDGIIARTARDNIVARAGIDIDRTRRRRADG